MGSRMAVGADGNGAGIRSGMPCGTAMQTPSLVLAIPAAADRWMWTGTCLNGRCTRIDFGDKFPGHQPGQVALQVVVADIHPCTTAHPQDVGKTAGDQHADFGAFEFGQGVGDNGIAINESPAVF